ncbi:hypothetical protein [Roseateles sp.]|uniref:hypothetical protein n=1 Tax=Roseateles sp. TaxID=1971397 RepID=UPI003BA9CA18
MNDLFNCERFSNVLMNSVSVLLSLAWSRLWLARGTDAAEDHFGAGRSIHNGRSGALQHSSDLPYFTLGQG